MDTVRERHRTESLCPAIAATAAVNPEPLYVQARVPLPSDPLVRPRPVEGSCPQSGENYCSFCANEDFGGFQLPTACCKVERRRPVLQATVNVRTGADQSRGDFVELFARDQVKRCVAFNPLCLV